MIPTNSPVTRAYTSYISLILIIISIDYFMESTSYFPNSKYILNVVNNYLEIQTAGRKPDITSNHENETARFHGCSPNIQTALFVSDSRTLPSGWGI